MGSTPARYGLGRVTAVAAMLSLAGAAAAPAPAEFSGDCIVAGRDDGRLVAAGKSRIERRRARIGLRVLDLPVRALQPQVPFRPNLCLNRARTGFPMPSSNSYEPSYGDCVWSAIDGVPWEGDFEWSSDWRNPQVPWYQVAFGKVVTLGEIRLWTRRGYPLRDFDVRLQERSGGWRTVAVVRGNRAEMREFTFPLAQAQAISVLCLSGPDHQPAIRRIAELQAFAPRPRRPIRARHFAYRVLTPPNHPYYLEVREAYGEGETLREVGYEVQVNGRVAFRRSHRCDGAGPISYAFPVQPSGAGQATVRFVDTSGQGLAIARVRVIVDPVGQAQRRGLLKPMVVAPRLEIAPPYTQPGPSEALGGWVAAMAPARPFLQPGLLAIVGYATPDAEAVRARVFAYAALAARHRVPWVLQLSSWWADTPLRVPDGLGGTFGDIRYQQIAYSRFDTYHDPGLKEYLDAVAPGTYSVHYGLTIPNLWSNTPWLTMNDARLNAFKVACLRRAIDAVNAVLRTPAGDLLQAIVTDDEPIYWTRIVDWREEGYARVNGGVARTDLLLDFNPCVIRDAAADGVRLDPRDGLSDAERQWLHENNARYVALICRTIHEALQPRPPGRSGPDLRERIFNYLLAQPLYPLEDYGHPGFEIGVVPHAAVGLEAGDERYFERARDLGPLANSDFECGHPNAETVNSWEPNFRAWHDAGCQFVQLCNPGPAENWRGLFARVGGWNATERTRCRALSALVQEAATAEWRRARWQAIPAR